MSDFQLWPAIDIIDGKPVRLYKGDYAKKTEYDQAFSYLSAVFSQFAFGIHVVDLDGAKAQKPVNISAITEIINNTKKGVLVEVGGGIRTMQDLEALFSIGVDRCILGTSALKDEKFLLEALSVYGNEKIVVGVDTHDGMVATHGWEESSKVDAQEFISKLETLGVKTIIYTDISTDGTLEGPPLKTFARLVSLFPKIEIIASGGVSNISDCTDLKNMKMAGVIFGKAFYEGCVTAEELCTFSL